jgi:hypothetical protein
MWEFGNDTMADRNTCIKAYLQHNERIRASVAPDQLLVWQAKDGWEPLCRQFLLLFWHQVIDGPSFPRQDLLSSFPLGVEALAQSNTEMHVRFHDHHVRHAIVSSTGVVACEL